MRTDVHCCLAINLIIDYYGYMPALLHYYTVTLSICLSVNPCHCQSVDLSAPYPSSPGSLYPWWRWPRPPHSRPARHTVNLSICPALITSSPGSLYPWWRWPRPPHSHRARHTVNLSICQSLSLSICLSVRPVPQLTWVSLSLMAVATSPHSRRARHTGPI